MGQTLRRVLDDGRAWEVELLERLVAVPSVSGRPSEISEVLELVLVELGLQVSRIQPNPFSLTGHPEFSPPDAGGEGCPPALHAADPEAAPAPELLLFAHTDTEPVHPGCAGDPFVLRVAGERAFGLGVCDDKAGVVSILGAIRAVRSAGLSTAWRPRVVLGSGKQGGSLGMLQGVEAAAGVGAAVYSHPAESGSGLGHLKVASRGIASLRVVVAGQTPRPVEIRTPVSADPRLGHNAAARVARLAADVEHWTSEAEVWSVVGIDCPARPFEVPAAATLELACWFSDGTVDQVARRAERRLRQLALDDYERDHPPVVTMHGIRANPASCADSTFGRSAAAVLAEVSGRAVEHYSWHSASDIRFPMRLLGVPAVGFGATAGGFYGPSEWVHLPSLHAATEVLVRVLLAGPAGGSA